LIRRFVGLPSSGERNDPYLTGVITGQHYPAWAVYLNYVSANRDMARTLWNYGDDLTAEQIKAVERFANVYPDIVMPYVDAALTGEPQ
jgi:hypothetical protein